jgi:hypothetical protein
MIDKSGPAFFLEARATPIIDYISARGEAKSVIIHESSYFAARRPAIDSSPSGITDPPSYRDLPVFRRVDASPVHTCAPAPRTDA